MYQVASYFVVEIMLDDTVGKWFLVLYYFGRFQNMRYYFSEVSREIFSYVILCHNTWNQILNFIQKLK